MYTATIPRKAFSVFLAVILAMAFNPASALAEGTSLSKATVGNVSAKTYSGAAITQAPTVKVGGKTLTPGVDYTIGCKDNVNAGKATIIITGKGAYSGTKTKTFKIKKASIKGASVAAVGNQPYTGKAIKPQPAVKMGDTALKPGRDYTLSYKNNKKAGTAKITVKGKGNYTGKKTISFKIVKSGTAAKKSTAKKTTAKKASGSSGGTVYITNTGSKYHKGSCSSLRKSKIAISKSDAKARGYTACKVCKP